MSSKQVQAQIEGGRVLGQIKGQLVEAARVGVALEDLDQLAEKLILKAGGQPSFKMVPGYFWSTCININEGIVHGIPKGTLKDTDLVTIDVGLYYKGLHTDTATSFVVGSQTPLQRRFLVTGKKTLQLAIDKAIVGNRVWDISQTIQENIEASGFSVVRNLTGHGVGKQLHQEPSIPCYVDRPRHTSQKLINDQALAIEVMYCQGGWQTVTAPDNWTISTKDSGLSAVFEETIIVTGSKPRVITAAP